MPESCNTRDCSGTAGEQVAVRGLHGVPRTLMLMALLTSTRVDSSQMPGARWAAYLIATSLPWTQCPTIARHPQRFIAVCVLCATWVFFLTAIMTASKCVPPGSTAVRSDVFDSKTQEHAGR